MELASLDEITLELTSQEQRVLDLTIEIMKSMKDLYGTFPHNWENEGIPAIHVLQQFVRQHWAHRINPEVWSNWRDSTKLTP